LGKRSAIVKDDLPIQHSDHAVEEAPALNKQAVALLSGGLDSALAIYLVRRQGIDVTALHFPSFFSGSDPIREDSPVKVLARQLGVPLVLRPKGKDFIQLIRNPRYGHGKNLNPCIDCRIYTFIKAREFMREIGATFMVTGEVAGQRPMSQRRDAMRLIDKQSGCVGIVLRPLSAKVLPTTRPEVEGMIDRDRLLAVAGRGRKIQLKMASEIGLVGYTPPAGGCLLTEQVFARRLRDLLDEKEEVTHEDLELLRVGRHIKIRPGLKIIVGRNEAENKRLQDLEMAGVMFAPLDFPGPDVLAVGSPGLEEAVLIGSIIRRYAKTSSRGEWIVMSDPSAGKMRIQVKAVASDEWIAASML
jgi:tRNA-specific 2-thiouridylase